jgi:protoporphyrinogen/coproporphyrinogen III oxidase
MTRVAIVGGGIAGLSLAFALEQQAAPGTLAVTVLEAAPRAGGNLRSEQVDGYLCEWGPNGFLDNVPATLALARDLGLERRLLPSHDAARRRFLYRAGRLHQLPEGPVSFFGSPLLSPAGRLRVACEPFARRRPEGDETIHAFAARRIGREAADVLIDAMVSGVFGGNARELSLRACFPKMYEMESAHGGLVRALLARRGRKAASGPVGSPLGRLTSFVEGIEELPLALLRALGDRVRTGARVEAVERTGRASGAWAWRLHLAGAEPAEADHVVFASGAAATGRALALLDPSLASVLGEIPSAPLAVVCLGYATATLEHPLDGFGFLVPRGEAVRALGALWDSSIFAGRAPEGRALVRVMLGGATDPDAVDLDDDALAREAGTALRAAMGVRPDPVFTKVVRHRVGIPQYTRGHLDRLALIERGLAGYPGLWVAGNSYRGVAINACVADAASLAARILGRAAA